MLLVLQIAAGIILAYLAIKFWKQAIWVTVVGILILGGLLWWQLYHDGVQSTVHAWDAVGAPVFEIVCFIFIALTVAGALNQWALKHPESKMGVPVIRVLDVLGIREWISKKP